MPNAGYPESESSENAISQTAGLQGAETENIKTGLRLLQAWISTWAIRKGWMNPENPRELLHLLMLTVTEISEAAEAHRGGNPACVRPGMESLSHVEEELADAVIRLVQIAAEHKLNLVEAIVRKMQFNETREVRHGKHC